MGAVVVVAEAHAVEAAGQDQSLANEGAGEDAVEAQEGVVEVAQLSLSLALLPAVFPSVALRKPLPLPLPLLRALAQVLPQPQRQGPRQASQQCLISWELKQPTRVAHRALCLSPLALPLSLLLCPEAPRRERKKTPWLLRCLVR